MSRIVLDKHTKFIHEPGEFPAAVIAAENVMHDMELIFGEPVGEYRDGGEAASEGMAAASVPCPAGVFPLKTDREGMRLQRRYPHRRICVEIGSGVGCRGIFAHIGRITGFENTAECRVG